MTEAFELAGPRLGDVEHAFTGIDPGDGALAARIPQKWPPVLQSEYAPTLFWSIFLRLTGFQLAGKCSAVMQAVGTTARMRGLIPSATAQGAWR